MASPKIIKSIIISGRAGSGKTSVANELYARFSQERIPHVRLEGDSLDEMYPEETNAEVFLANLSSMWQNFTRLRDSTRLLINGTAVVLEAEAICRTLEEASKEVDGSESVKVETRAFVLRSSDDTIRTRLQSRESGLTLEKHIESSLKMSRVLGALRADWLEFVDTEDRTVAQVADHVVQRCIEWFER